MCTLISRNKDHISTMMKQYFGDDNISTVEATVHKILVNTPPENVNSDSISKKVWTHFWYHPNAVVVCLNVFLLPVF